MTTLTEGNTPGDVLLFEEDNHYSRELVTIAAGANLEPGAVLGEITASGKFAISEEDAATGVETAAAVLLTSAPAAEADVENAIVIKRHARVRRGGLVFHASYDTETKRDAAVAALKSAGILTDV